MSSFKVAVIGGSVAGLTVALHLEQLGIDYVLIERHHTIAPQLGASFSLNPNGLSVLSQLGCFDDIDKECEPMKSAVVRDGNGKILSSFEIGNSVSSVFGYDVCFTERRALVKTLFQHIQHKQKIITGETVIDIQHTNKNVRVITEKGSVFTADVVVGADGIHSPVRRAMWRIANEEDRTVFGDDPSSSIQTEFGCVFGISQETNDLKAGEAIQVHSKGLLIGTLLGPADVVYWFLIFALPTALKGLDLPRYTEKDEERLVATAKDMMIKPGTTFGDIYDNKKMSYMTPLPDGSFNRWHYKRIVCVGDSAHKLNPLTGQGGCMALESAIALTDSLGAALKLSGGQSLSVDQIDTAFETATTARRERAVAVATESVRAIRLGTWSNKILEMLDKYVIGYVPAQMMMKIMTASCHNGYIAESLPQPVPKYETESSKAAAMASPA